MILKNDLSKIKEDISFCIGQKVRLTTNKGKKKVLTKEGIVEGTYANIFTVRFDAEDKARRESYNYADILTNTVELIRCSDNVNLYEQRMN